MENIRIILAAVGAVIAVITAIAFAALTVITGTDYALSVPFGVVSIFLLVIALVFIGMVYKDFGAKLETVFEIFNSPKARWIETLAVAAVVLFIVLK